VLPTSNNAVADASLDEVAATGRDAAPPQSLSPQFTVLYPLTRRSQGALSCSVTQTGCRGPGSPGH
jgi:hypothetical protein